MGNKQPQTAKTKNSKEKGAPQRSVPRSDRQQRFRQECAMDENDEWQAPREDGAIKFIGLIRGKFGSKTQVHCGTGAIISEDLVLTVAHNVCSIDSRSPQFKKYKQFLQSTLSATLSATALSTTSSSAHALSAEEAMEEFKHAEMAEWLEFYPGLSGEVRGLQSMQQIFLKRNSEGNFVRVRAFKVHPGFITEANNQMYDLCLLRLETPLSLPVEKIKILENYTNTATEISVFGYPLNLCFSEQAGRLTASQFGAQGRFLLEQELGRINYRIPTGSGQSGSPIFINTTNAGRTEHFCIGIHQGGTSQVKNIGIHLNEERVRWIAEAEEQLTGRLSKVATAKFPRLPENNVPTRPPKDVTEKSLEDYEAEIREANLSAEKAGEASKRAIYLHKEAALLCVGQEWFGRAIGHYEAFVGLMEALGEGRNEEDEEEWEAALINLAKSYCEEGDHLRSLALYEQAHQQCLTFLSLTVEKESLILNNKGAVLVQLGRFEEALDLFRQAHALRLGKFGEESILTYNSLENVASMRLQLGTAVAESLRDYERVFRFKERKFGVGSREAIRTKTNLSFALLRAARYRDGIQGCYYCLEKLRLAGEGRDHEEFLKQFTKLMRELCRADCALEDLKSAFGLCQKYGLEELGRELDDEWSKRSKAISASQSP